MFDNEYMNHMLLNPDLYGLDSDKDCKKNEQNQKNLKQNEDDEE